MNPTPLNQWQADTNSVLEPKTGGCICEYLFVKKPLPPTSKVIATFNPTCGIYIKLQTGNPRFFKLVRNDLNPMTTIILMDK